MRGFLGAVTGYPTAVFTFALVVVVGYWVLVLVGGAHLHGARGGHGGGHHGHGGGGRHGHGGFQRGLGLGGVPITVAVSLVVAFAWFTALVLRTRVGHGGADWGLLPAGALAGGWVGARLLVVPLRRLLPEPVPPPSRRDFVGLGCVIRTGRVGPDFGQAEVRAADGSAAVVQVRQSAEDAGAAGAALKSGSAALIYEYDAEGEFFWVMPAPAQST
ncbi:hypothetical protein ACFYNO_22455 [Kitasatospora sp. NPDC006697]|uniref:hypothetical protein n=1 Tax=Kitasatospora sp. NPDC006697 TaxID=3364020 RepID=UPI0036A24978